MAAKKQQSQLPLESSPTDRALQEGLGKVMAKLGGSIRNEHGSEEGGVEIQAPNQGQSSQELSFEGAIERLSEIVEQLEAEGQPLETSLELFEEGIRLARESQSRLESAEKKVEELLAYDSQGQPVVEELDPD